MIAPVFRERSEPPRVRRKCAAFPQGEFISPEDVKSNGAPMGQ